MEINETECSQLLANIEERIDQYEKDKSHFERLINARKLELAQLENLLQITTNSLGVQKSLLKAIECKKCSTIRTDRETQTETAAVSNINVADILRKIGNIVPAVEEKPKITKQENVVNKSLLSSPGGWKSPSKIKPTDSTKATPQLRVQSTQLGAGKPATISRINNALKLCAKRNEPKKVIKDFPNRIKDPSMMDFNSKLVELHRNEEQHLDYNSVTEWTVLKCGPNRRLERLMEKRNREKLQKIERQPECAKLVARADLVANIGLLMNYDLIRHVDRKSKPRRVKKPRNEQKNEPKTKIIANDEKKDSVLMDDFMFDMIDAQISTEAANSRPNNEDDDLYGDLNGPTVNLDFNLLEDGEVDEEKEEDRLEKKSTTKTVTGIKQIDENVPKSREADRNAVKKLRTDDGGSKALQPQSQFVSKENQNESSSKNKNQMNNQHRNHHQHQQSDAYRSRHDNSRHRDRSRSRSKPRSRPGRMRSRSRSRSESRRRGDSPPRKQQQQQTSSSKYHSSRDRIDHNYNNNKRKRLD